MTTALFMGRFQPPHIGHLLTIRSLAAKYDKLVVGVTEAEPSVMQIDNVIAILQQLLPEKNISFIRVKGSVEGGTAVIDFEFDVCCSGNPNVLSVMAAKGYKTEYTERSFDSIFSGTKERQLYIESALENSEASAERDLTAFKLLSVESLRPIEKINPRHYQAIEDKVLEDKTMYKPIIVDKVTLAVLDGSHRYAFLLKNGFELAPVLMCDYDDESIFVGSHLGHRYEYDNNKWISKKHVRATAVSGRLYDPRTTRHFFPFRKKDYPTALDMLGKAQTRSINHLLAGVSKEQEIASNDEYIAELEHELQVLKSYVDEQSQVMQWLKRQNEYIVSQEK